MVFAAITYKKGFSIVRFMVLIAILTMFTLAGILSVYTYRGSQENLHGNEISLEAGIGLIAACVLLAAVLTTMMMCFDALL